MSDSPVLLDEHTVIDYLRKRDVEVPLDSTARSLGGGVSNVVLSVDGSGQRIIVKQSLPQLKVESEWFAPVDRILSEARSIVLMKELLPDAAPTLLSTDDERFIISMTGAPPSWMDWKQRLLMGDVAQTVPELLGSRLASLHATTQDGSGLDDEFFDESAFEQLRIDPYFRHTAHRVPELREAILATVEQMAAHRSCLVHGDFSPKNLLVDPDQTQVWFIDFEVAHYGDPAFDIAFLLSHLMLKAMHRPQSAAKYDAAANTFMQAYETARGDETPQKARIMSLVGCLLAARVEGKSPVEYLTADQRVLAMRTATAILRERPSAVSDLTRARTEGAP